MDDGTGLDDLPPSAVGHPELWRALRCFELWATQGGPARWFLEGAVGNILSDLGVGARRYGWRLPAQPHTFGLGLRCVLHVGAVFL